MAQSMARNRQARKPEVITSSPYKNALVEKIAQRGRPAEEDEGGEGLEFRGGVGEMRRDRATVHEQRV